MRKNGKRLLLSGSVLLVLFAVWTVLIQTVDVQPAGETGTEVGFATVNVWFHGATGAHMQLYTLTDWLGLVPVAVCLLFGAVGLVQWVKRKSLRKVDPDVLLLGVYYVLVIAGYLVFEAFPINYRPILIDGRMEASYPSSTTLLVISVMPTLAFQAKRRLQRAAILNSIRILTIMFCSFMVIGRLVSGVHWVTDIVGSVFLSMGLFQLYQAAVAVCCKEKY